MTDQEFIQIRELVYRRAGIVLNDSKRHLVRSRLQKRLRFYGLESFGDYYKLVMKDQHGPEMIEFINALTTNKTDFFRESHHFEFVQNHIVPELIQKAKTGQMSRTLRIWHAGCSTGEEAYTMAMALRESKLISDGWDIKLLATDIGTHVLERARLGQYDEEKVLEVPEHLRKKYFTRGEGELSSLYQVKEELKEMIRFRRLNLQDETWPFKTAIKFDLILCRNVVIYFDKPTQRRLFDRFSTRLKNGGYLFIGHSENLFGVSDKFQPLGGTIYQLPQIGRAA